MSSLYFGTNYPYQPYRNFSFMLQLLNGDTFEKVADHANMSNSRIREIVSKFARLVISKSCVQDPLSPHIFHRGAIGYRLDKDAWVARLVNYQEHMAPKPASLFESCSFKRKPFTFPEKNQ
jgi:hypothetical protein